MTELALGISLGLGAGLAPGPLLVLVVNGTLRSGFGAGARVALAPLVTDVPIIVLCVLVLREIPDDALAGLSLAGAAFVGWLAFDALRASPAAAADARADLRRAALVNALSPHPWLFWLTVGGPLLVAAGAESAALAVAFLAGFYLMLVGAKVALAGLVHLGRRRSVLPRAVTSRFGAPAALRRLGPARIVSALLLTAVAVVLLADGVERLA